MRRTRWPRLGAPGPRPARASALVALLMALALPTGTPGQTPQTSPPRIDSISPTKVRPEGRVVVKGGWVARSLIGHVRGPHGPLRGPVPDRIPSLWLTADDAAHSASRQRESNRTGCGQGPLGRVYGVQQPAPAPRFHLR